MPCAGFAAQAAQKTHEAASAAADELNKISIKQTGRSVAENAEIAKAKAKETGEKVKGVTVTELIVVIAPNKYKYKSRR